MTIKAQTGPGGMNEHPLSSPSNSPLELASREDLDLYADTFGLDREMVRLVRKCPQCAAPILVPDNGVWLDVKPSSSEMAIWRIFELGPFKMAGSGGAPDEEGSRHTLHEHQPEEAGDV